MSLADWPTDSLTLTCTTGCDPPFCKAIFRTNLGPKLIIEKRNHKLVLIMTLSLCSWWRYNNTACNIVCVKQVNENDGKKYVSWITYVLHFMLMLYVLRITNLLLVVAGKLEILCCQVLSYSSYLGVNQIVCCTLSHRMQ